VQVHFSHLLISGLVAFSFAGAGWTCSSLQAAPPPSTPGLFVLIALSWLALITSTVLIHEMGQAFALFRMGRRATVHLIGIGGRTLVDETQPLDPRRLVLVTLAGPLAGAAAFTAAELASAGLGRAGVLSPPQQTALHVFSVANLMWAGFNLLPVPPLAGSRLLAALLSRVFGPRGVLLSQYIAIAFCAALGVWGAVTQRYLLSALAVLFAFRSLAVIAALRREQTTPRVTASPQAERFADAERLYQEGKLEDARVRLAQLAEVDLDPALRSKVHLLWGWIEVKKGHGRGALDHFSQVQGMTVAPQALAAAFSLIGDDARALPLWITAAESGELTLRAELGGCLLRLGREADARKLPELRFSQSLLAAERVYFLRGEYGKAAAAAEAAFQEEPSADLAYDAACGYARASDPEGALRMLQLASQNGFSKIDVVEADSDLTSLRTHPRFIAWLDSLRQKTAGEPTLENSTVLTKG
jgi:Zn-dependent protease